nr:hypothetical protein GCM10020092_083070 [Actinoplanes digitatis]
MRAVETLGLVRRRQPEEQHNDLGAGGGPDGLVDERGVGGAGLDGEAGCEGDLAAAAERLAQRVQRAVEPGRVDLRGAGALEARGAGELADDRDGAAGARVEG